MVTDGPEPHCILVAGMIPCSRIAAAVTYADTLRLRKGVVDAPMERKGELVRQLIVWLDVIAVLVELAGSTRSPPQTGWRLDA